MENHEINATLNRAFQNGGYKHIREFIDHHNIDLTYEFARQFIASRYFRGRKKQFVWKKGNAGSLLQLAWALEVPKPKIIEMLQTIGDRIYWRILKGEKPCEYSGGLSAAEKLSLLETANQLIAESAVKKSRSKAVPTASSTNIKEHNLSKVLDSAKTQKRTSPK